jgi:hypothetical protein
MGGWMDVSPGPITGVRKRNECEKRKISEFGYFVSWHRTIHCNLSFTQSGILREIPSVMLILYYIMRSCMICTAVPILFGL